MMNLHVKALGPNESAIAFFGKNHQILNILGIDFRSEVEPGVPCVSDWMQEDQRIGVSIRLAIPSGLQEEQLTFIRSVIEGFVPETSPDQKITAVVRDDLKLVTLSMRNPPAASSRLQLGAATRTDLEFFGAINHIAETVEAILRGAEERAAAEGSTPATSVPGLQGDLFE